MVNLIWLFHVKYYFISVDCSHNFITLLDESELFEPVELLELLSAMLPPQDVDCTQPQGSTVHRTEEATTVAIQGEPE